VIIWHVLRGWGPHRRGPLDTLAEVLRLPERLRSVFLFLVVRSAGSGRQWGDASTSWLAA